MSVDQASGRTYLLLFSAMLAIGGEAGYWWWSTRTDVYTDNAYVVSNITPIASDVTGQIVAMFVDDNMYVQPGDPIAQINPVEFQIAVDQALAEYQQADQAAEAAEVTTVYTADDRKSMLDAAEAHKDEAERAVSAAGQAVTTKARLHEMEKEELASLKAQLPGLEALRTNAKYYYDRYKSLAGTGDVPVQEFDNREAAYRESIAKVLSLNSDIKAAERQVLASEFELHEAEDKLAQSKKAYENTEAMVGRAEAEQKQPTIASDTAKAMRHQQMLAEAKLRDAKIRLSDTLIRAPRAGIIGRRTLQVGRTVDAGKPFLSIVPLDFDNLWIVANLRENQMPNVRIGQSVSITVDAIADKTFHGWVESVAGGSGAVFSLFPPDNATGNFVRVVQRLPVRVRFSDKENYQNRIRPGMSTRVTIDTTNTVRQGSQGW